MTSGAEDRTSSLPLNVPSPALLPRPPPVPSSGAQVGPRLIPDPRQQRHGEAGPDGAFCGDWHLVTRLPPGRVRKPCSPPGRSRCDPAALVPCPRHATPGTSSSSSQGYEDGESRGARGRVKGMGAAPRQGCRLEPPLNYTHVTPSPRGSPGRGTRTPHASSPSPAAEKGGG